jgi:hypothetical protein
MITPDMRGFGAVQPSSGRRRLPATAIDGIRICKADYAVSPESRCAGGAGGHRPGRQANRAGGPGVRVRRPWAAAGRMTGYIGALVALALALDDVEFLGTEADQ